jgi:hypothetical protein
MADKPKYALVGSFLTQQEIEVALTMWNRSKRNFARRIHDQFILPNINRIDAALGQKNDPMFLAFLVEYAFTNAAILLGDDVGNTGNDPA